MDTFGVGHGGQVDVVDALHAGPTEKHTGPAQKHGEEREGS